MCKTGECREVLLSELEALARYEFRNWGSISQYTYSALEDLGVDPESVIQEEIQ